MENTGEEKIKHCLNITCLIHTEMMTELSVHLVAVAHVPRALRAPLAKPTLTTVKTTTARTERPASMGSTTTPVFVRHTTQVCPHRYWNSNRKICCRQDKVANDRFIQTVEQSCFCVGEMCEEMEDVCAPGRSPCQHQSTCLITSTGPK